jgi:hypothetical protein
VREPTAPRTPPATLYSVPSVLSRLPLFIFVRHLLASNYPRGG